MDVRLREVLKGKQGRETKKTPVSASAAVTLSISERATKALSSPNPLADK